MVGVTGVGSLPGTDYPAAVRLVFDTLGSVDNGLPHLPELPARGPWAGLIGRACGLLVDLPVSFDAGVWRLSDATGIDGRRARATLRDDLDVLEENAQGLTGPLRITATGPWTLAATTLAPRGGHVLKDASARRDLAQSLAAGLTDLRAHLPYQECDPADRLEADRGGGAHARRLVCSHRSEDPRSGGFARRPVQRGQSSRAPESCTSFCQMGRSFL